jgi:hypothetical protein
MMSVAPIAFLDPRGASQYYIPLFGWALYTAVALARGSAWLLKNVPGRAGYWVRYARAPAVFACVMLLLYPFYRRIAGMTVHAATVDEEVVRTIDSQMHALYPTLPPAARLLFRNEPDNYVWDNLGSIIRLSYGYDDIVVDRIRKMKAPPSANEISAYDHVLEYQGGRLTEPVHIPEPNLKPALVEMLHSDFSAITPGHPARPGDIVIAKATGLGVTEPEVEAGQPFPREPLVVIASRIEVKVGGRRAQIANQIGWPKTVDTYRVDFRVPDDVPAGTARVELKVRETAARAMDLLVSARR